ncbi:MAG TPA: hypothetical protein V6C72_04700 [Chroococcales cyanobacterium]
MKGNIMTEKVALLAFCTSLIALPAFATYPNETQPALGSIKAQELNLDKRLTADFNKGLIDSMELAQMRRDLDGIRNHEEYQRTDRLGGLPTGAEKNTIKKLRMFSARLDMHEADRALAGRNNRVQ